MISIIDSTKIHTYHFVDSQRKRENVGFGKIPVVLKSYQRVFWAMARDVFIAYKNSIIVIGSEI